MLKNLDECEEKITEIDRVNKSQTDPLDLEKIQQCRDKITILKMSIMMWLVIVRIYKPNSPSGSHFAAIIKQVPIGSGSFREGLKRFMAQTKEIVQSVQWELDAQSAKKEDRSEFPIKISSNQVQHCASESYGSKVQVENTVSLPEEVNSGKKEIVVGKVVKKEINVEKYKRNQSECAKVNGVNHQNHSVQASSYENQSRIISDLNQQIGALQQSIRFKDGQTNKFRKENETLKGKMCELEDVANESRKANEVNEAELAVARDELNQAQKQLDENCKANKVNETELAVAKDKLNQAQKQLDKSRDANKKLMVKFDAVSLENGRLRDENSSLGKIIEFEKTAEIIKNKITHIENEKKELENRSKLLLQEKTEISNSITKLQQEISAMKKDLKEIKKDYKVVANAQYIKSRKNKK
jgi:chromosome segregation ATPase